MQAYCLEYLVSITLVVSLVIRQKDTFKRVCTTPSFNRLRLHTHLNNYTRAHVSLLFGVLGIYNFGGALVNPTEGYFQVNGYSFSSLAKNDVSE